ncbi:M1 family metallopeptidase [Flavobacteriaceae bacterium TK19130]|nr:M1 family metallopeptidase [Thermobacterium salinum]
MKCIYPLLFLAVSSLFAQQTERVNFLRIHALVEPEAATESVSGTLEVTFKILTKTDSIYLDAHKMQVRNVKAENISLSTTEDRIWMVGDFQKDNTYTASFDFMATPRQTLYFTGDQIWTQGQGKYTSHWLPSLDDMNDKIEFDLSIKAPIGKTVISNGSLVKKNGLDGKREWKYDMQNSMPSYLVALAIGNFEKNVQNSKRDVLLETYYPVGEDQKAEPTYRYTAEIFNFLESEIGVDYPWQNYKQVPVRDFLYAGMENTTATIFSEAFLVDSIGFNDRNYVNVNAHELAHQWFGNLVTETEGTHHWLQEGFATFYALLAEREIFGDDYYYWQLYNSAEQLKALSDEGKGEKLVNPNASSLTFYQKGAWALHILREIIGVEAFRQSVKQYLEKYAYQNVTTENFLAEVRSVTETDISQWEKDWLQQSAFQSEQAYQSLLKSPFITEYFEIAALRETPLADKKEQLQQALTLPNDYIGQEAVQQLYGEPFSETEPLLMQALESNNLYVRQTVAMIMEEIPVSFQQEYETLLEDDSYLTKEIALQTLWMNFTDKRKEYLDRLNGVVGFQDRNVEQLWLALAFLTDAYSKLQKATFKSRLQGFTSSTYSFEVRQKAFEYINQLQLYNDDVIGNLINAAVHHNWRFRTFARDLLTELLKNPGPKDAVYKNFNSFSEEEKAYLNRLNVKG